MTLSSVAARTLHGTGIVLVLAVMRPSAAADEATLLDETGSGVVPVNSETALRVRAVEGQLVIARGVEGEVEFRTTSLEKEGAEVPLALSTDGEVFRLEPPQGRESTKARLQLSIPPGMRVRLDLDHAALSLVGLDGDLVVHGRQLQVEAQGLLKSVAFQIEGGAVRVYGVAGRATIRGRDLDVVLDRVSGPTDVSMSGGTAKLSDLRAGLQGDFTGSSVSIDTVADSVALRFQKGKAEIARLQDGGDIVSTGCPLRMEQVAGKILVTSDSEVRFNDCQASLHVENSAGSVTGVKNDGLLEVTTHNAQVALAQISGQLRIAGDHLDVKLENIGATVGVSTTASSVTVVGATDAVTIENDGGDVTIKRTEAPIDIKTRGGEVKLLRLRGPITVQADGEHVAVEWEVLPDLADSHISNEGGDVTVHFPAVSDGRVDATSRLGHVESDLPKVVVLQEGGSAQGVVGNAGTSLKTIFVSASGDVKLLGPDNSSPPGQAP